MKKLMYLFLALPLLFSACGDDDYETNKLISVFEENLDSYSNNYVNEESAKSELSAYKRELEKAIQKGDKDKVKFLEDQIQYQEKSQENSKNIKEKRYAVLVDKFPKLMDDVKKYAFQRLHYIFTIPTNLEYSKVLKKEMDDMKDAMIERIKKGDY